ncbi:MAG: response regulator [Verrucomicrobia bacterium]|nr:response regulator [Verrucomicrobiota bacterium]
MSRSHPAPLKTILLVDDGDDLRVTTKWFLTHFGYVVDAARNVEEALALFNPAIHDLVVTDNSMPGMTGTEMAHVIKLRSPTTPILMYTGNPPDDQSCLAAPMFQSCISVYSYQSLSCFTPYAFLFVPFGVINRTKCEQSFYTTSGQLRPLLEHTGGLSFTVVSAG